VPDRHLELFLTKDLFSAMLFIDYSELQIVAEGHYSERFLTETAEECGVLWRTMWEMQLKFVCAVT
jgi:hypothetical protein